MEKSGEAGRLRVTLSGAHEVEAAETACSIMGRGSLIKRLLRRLGLSLPLGRPHFLSTLLQGDPDQKTLSRMSCWKTRWRRLPSRLGRS